MWHNKSVAKINTMFKILDIRSLRSIFFKNKFGFRIGAINPNMSFPYTLVHKNGLKRNKIDKMGTRSTEWTKQDKMGTRSTEVDQIRTNGQIRTKVDIMHRIGKNRTKYDQIGSMLIEQDQSGQNGPNKNEWTDQDQSGHNGLNRTNVN